MKKLRIFISKKTITAVLCILFGSSALAQGGVDSSAPTAPTDLIAVATSDSEISLSWNPATDDRQVVSYQVKRENVVVSTSANTFFTDTGLRSGRRYTYTIVASDGTNLSAPAIYTLATLATGVSTEPSAKPVESGNSPEAEVTPFRPFAVTAAAASSNVPAGYTNLVFSDEFDGTGPLDVTSSERNWRFEMMQDGLHRAGNTGIDADGNIITGGNSVRGKRWSGWYDDLNNDNTTRSNGVLTIGGSDTGLLDPTRPIDYLDNGTVTEFGASKLYTSWIDTFSRVFDNGVGAHVKDPDAPGKSFKYGYVEASVSFELMNTPGFRFSMWLMPASIDAEGNNLVMTHAYDNLGDNGVEIDIFEYEWINTDNGSRIQGALIGGAAGTNTISVDVSTFSPPIDLSQGFHTLSLLWEEDTLEWQINGQTFHSVTDINLIPDVYLYIIMSREMNSGVKRSGNNDPDTETVEQPPFIPADPGLFANNIWEFRERLVTDKAMVDYIRVWQKP